MTLTIDLTRDQADILQQVAISPTSSRQTVLHDLTVTLPDGHVLTVDIITRTKKEMRRKTPAEMVAAWKASGLPSVYARDPRDATVIAQELRAKAERRDWSGE